MIGPILIAVFLLVIFPIGLSLSGAIVAALHGNLGTQDAEARFEGHELLELSQRKYRR
jgi:hypothetical protein